MTNSQLRLILLKALNNNPLLSGGLLKSPPELYIWINERKVYF